MTSAKRRRTRWFVAAAIPLGLAALLVFSGLVVWLGGVPDHYLEAMGTVVEGGAETIIRFQDVSGSEVQFEPTMSAEEGDTFTVFYDPASPAGTAFTAEGQSAAVVSTLGVAVFFGVVGAFLAGVGAWRYRRYGSAADS